MHSAYSAIQANKRRPIIRSSLDFTYTNLQMAPLYRHEAISPHHVFSRGFMERKVESAQQLREGEV